KKSARHGIAFVGPHRSLILHVSALASKYDRPLRHTAASALTRAPYHTGASIVQISPPGSNRMFVLPSNSRPKLSMRREPKPRCLGTVTGGPPCSLQQKR